MLPKKLAQFVAATAETTVYTVPASNYCMLKEIVAANSSNSAQTLSISIVPTGNTASVINRILPAVSIAPNTVAIFDFSTVLATGDFISASCSGNGAVTVTVSGLEETGAGTSSGTGNFASTGMVVTSTTRPSAPYVGQVIYESDTFRMLMWNGYSWTGNTGTPVTLGYVELASTWTAATTGNAEADVAGLAVTVTVPAGRRIKVSGMVHLRSTTAGDLPYSRLRIDGSNIGFAYSNEVAVSRSSPYIEAVLSPSAGTHTFKVTATNTGGAGTASVYSSYTTDSNKETSYLCIEDITGDPMPVAVNSVPVGQLGYSPNTTNQSFTNAAQITVATASVVVPAGRVLKVTGYPGRVSASNANDLAILRINEDGAQIQREDHWIASNAGTGVGRIVSVVTSPSAGSHVYALTAIGVNATTYNTNAASGNPAFLLVEDITPTPATSSSAPSSTLGYAEVTAVQTGITTLTDLTGLTATVTVAAGRRLRITGSVFQFTRTAGTATYADLRIREGSTEFNRMTAGFANTYEGAIATAIISPAAGTHTYKLSASSDATVTMEATTSNPAFILVEDITPASVYPVPISNGLAIVSSTTRPSPTSEGLAIYETDTDIIQVWNGAVWKEVWAPMTAAKATCSGTTSIPNGGYTKITFNTLQWEYGGSSYSTSNSNYVVPRTGLYAIQALCQATGGTLLNLAAFINAGVVVSDGMGHINDGAQGGYYSYYDELPLTAGDVVDMRMQNVSGSGSATVQVLSNRQSPRFEIRRIGPAA